MADTIKLGNQNISAFKVGSNDCKIYLGTTLLYSGGTTPPTPTYQWVTYAEGDTVPSSTIYGVKLYAPYYSGSYYYIDFSNSVDYGVSFFWENGDWGAIDYETQEPIDISSYYDANEDCYIILFSDLGYSGLPIYYPNVGETFEFDVDLYEQV